MLPTYSWLTPYRRNRRYVHCHVDLLLARILPTMLCLVHTLTLHTPPPLTGRYQYRWGLQGNFFPGDALRFSLVPPCLYTGANFGCTAFLGGLHRMEVQGKLGREVRSACCALSMCARARMCAHAAANKRTRANPRECVGDSLD